MTLSKTAIHKLHTNGTFKFIRLYSILTISCLSFIILSSCDLNKPKIKNFDSKKENLYIFLCIGQSNMAGRAEIEQQDLDSLDNVLLFTDNERKPWEKAANPMNKYSTIRKNINLQKLGPTYSFAKAMTQALLEKNIGLVVNAKGGTSIEEWKPGGSLYSEAIIQTRKAIKHGVLKGIIWHQGESDASKYNDYMPKLKELIKSLRDDLNLPNLPFVVGQLSPAKSERINFNNMILELTQELNYTGVVTTDQTSTIDKTHFDSASQRLLGKRYAKEMLRLIE